MKVTVCEISNQPERFEQDWMALCEHAKLADVTATLLALSQVELDPDGKGFPLAINVNTSLLGNQREGEIKAEARFVRNGKRVTVVRTRVTGAHGRLLAEITTTHIPAP